MRAGLHAGPALEHDARYLGGALNLTARVAGHARAGQILCTRSIARAAAHVSGVECREIESVRFKNSVDPVVVCEVLAPRGCAESLAVDPVCRMQVRPDTAAGRLVVAGRTFYFCSLECVRTFASRPDQYAPA